MEQAINGMKKHKLLEQTIKFYFIYSILVVVIIGPLFYIMSNVLYEKDANEDLYATKKQFETIQSSKLKLKDINQWNKFNRNASILPFNGNHEDNLFDHNYYDAINKEYEPYRVLNSPVKIDNHLFTFSTKINMVEKENLLGCIAILFATLLLLLILGFLLITQFISKKLWQPFYATLEKMEQFEVGNFFLMSEIECKTEEFHRLNLVVDKLISKNNLIFKSQREFIENAAHELQTPIAIFRVKIENILQNKDLNSEQFNLINELYGTISRLVKLNKSLLVLSKIDSKTYTLTDKVNINEVILNQIDFFCEQATSKNNVITSELFDNVTINSNLILIEVLISNLFLNTINHNKTNGEIQIILNKQKLVFMNSGIDKPLQKEKMFERFSKSNPSSQGNGLGLSIIKKIVDTNQWAISYYYKNSLHTFEITF